MFKDRNVVKVRVRGEFRTVYLSRCSLKINTLLIEQLAFKINPSLYRWK